MNFNDEKNFLLLKVTTFFTFVIKHEWHSSSSENLIQAKFWETMIYFMAKLRGTEALSCHVPRHQSGIGTTFAQECKLGRRLVSWYPRLAQVIAMLGHNYIVSSHWPNNGKTLLYNHWKGTSFKVLKILFILFIHENHHNYFLF